LAAECISDQGGAAETATGQLSAAWAAGPGILYRIGTSPIVPPATKDSQIALGGGVPFRVAEAVDVAGNDDVYVAWAQQFSHAKVDNGYYVKDVSSNGPVLRAPGSGTNSVNDLPEDANLAIASTNTHKGVFLLYCNNAPTCTDLLLWRVGAPKAIVVPGSAGADAFHYALSTGPDGRLWLAWYSHSTNDVSTVRTNMADTAFGPVETYTTPCFEDGLLGLSGGNWGAWGSWGLLDVVLQCVANSNLKETDDYTQSLTALGLTPTHATVDDAALFLVSHQVRYTVTDAGDPVAGALVTVAGMYASTNVAGQATFTFPKTLTPGEYPVDASASLYIDGRADLTVLKK
jgi:hypothetical protein